jgi:hypothetical protein
LDGYNYALDETLLNRLVFERVRTLNLNGFVNSIESSAFKSSFGQLTDLTIMVPCLANFFHQVGLEWTGYLSNVHRNIWINFQEDVDLSVNNKASWLNPGFGYTYPNKDLCIFARFSFVQPQQKQADGSPALITALTYADWLYLGCTDPGAWLTHNFNVNNLFSDKHFFKGPYDVNEPMEVYKRCWSDPSHAANLSAIRTKISQCSSLENGQLENYKVYMNYDEICFIFQFVFDVSAFVLIPFASILGLLLNARVVWTVLKKGKKELDESFYKYMTVNSIFNCLFCLVYAFYPVNFCQRYETGYFCSTIYNSLAAQVIKIVFQIYLGEVFKMCSNITFIFITINRYMLVGKEHNFALTKISELNIKPVIVMTIVFSLLINIGHCFQYRINYGWGRLLDENGWSQLTYDSYPSIVIFNSSFQVYSIVYFCINFVAFFLINTCVEASLVQKMRAEVSEKRQRVEEEIRVSAANNSSGSEVVNKVIASKQKKIVEDAKKETRAIKMVVTNSLVNFFLRLPEILVFLSSNSSFLASLVYVYTINDEHRNLQSTFLLNDISITLLNISYFFYILNFTTCVAIYCVFNKKFRQHFTWWAGSNIPFNP